MMLSLSSNSFTTSSATTRSRYPPSDLHSDRNFFNVLNTRRPAAAPHVTLATFDFPTSSGVVNDVLVERDVCSQASLAPFTPRFGDTDDDQEQSDAEDECGLSGSLTLTLPVLPSSPLAFRRDLDRVEQEHLVKAARAEQHENWIMAQEIEKTSWSVAPGNWSKQQQSYSLLFLAVESHRFQKIRMLSPRFSSTSQKTENAGPMTRGGPPVSPQKLRKLNLANTRVMAMLVHDIRVLVDNKKDIDRFDRVRNQLIDMKMWI